MTSTPDQFPAATEVAEIPATDPVEKAPAVESEPSRARSGSAGKGDSEGSAEAFGRVGDGSEAGQPTNGAAGATSAAQAPAGDDGPPEALTDEDEPAAGGEETIAAGAGRAEKLPAEPTAKTPSVPEHDAEHSEAAEVADAAAGPDAEPEATAADPTAQAEAAAAEAAAAKAVKAQPTQRYEAAPTEEIAIVPAAARPKPAAPAPGPAAPVEPEHPAAEDTTPEPSEATASDAEPGAEPATAPEAEADDDGSEPATPSAAGASEPAATTPSGRETTPVIDETFDFKALSFAAIAAAHKKALGPRTVVGEAETPEEQRADAEGSPTEAAGDAPTEALMGDTPAEALAGDTPEKEAPAEEGSTGPRGDTPSGEEAPTEAPELFASPATRIQPDPVPPSPFPTPAAPTQHHLGAPTQAQPSAPQQPPSPFPAPRGGSAHSFPAVHEYAPEASYAGWHPPTPAEETAKRRRFALIGGAVLAVVAVVAVTAVIVNVVNRQQWEPIEAMIAEPQEVHPLQLVLGSCVESIPADGDVFEVLAVPCDSSHTAQVVGRTDFADAAVWPGRDDVDKRIAQVCGTKQLGPVARTSPVADTVSYVVWGPSEASWDDGDRVGLCLATTPEPITQDLLQ
jgi:hypothetical protein